MAPQTSPDHFFTTVRDNIVFQMEMIDSDDTNSLEIRILYCDTAEEYQLLLTSEDLQNDKTFRDKFEELHDIYSHIRGNFEVVKLYGSGIINFSISINAEDQHFELKTQRCKTIRDGSLMIKDLTERISELKLEA